MAARALLDDGLGLGRLLAHDGDLALLDDARLLRRHLGDRGAELGMVERDGADHRDVPGHQVRGVPRPAHADLVDPSPTGRSANHRYASAVSASK